MIYNWILTIKFLNCYHAYKGDDEYDDKEIRPRSSFGAIDPPSSFGARHDSLKITSVTNKQANIYIKEEEEEDEDEKDHVHFNLHPEVTQILDSNSSKYSSRTESLSSLEQGHR